MLQYCKLFDMLLAASQLQNFDACNADADVAQGPGGRLLRGRPQARSEEDVHNGDADERV